MEVSGISRRGLLLILPVSLLAHLQNAIAADLVPPMKPNRIGQVIVWRNKKFTSIKSGKKIIWNKGVPLKITTIERPSPRVSPTVYAPPNQEFLVGSSSDFKIGELIAFSNPSQSDPGRGYLLIRHASGIDAFTNKCTHEGAEVEIEKGKLVCYRHLSYFNPDDGEVLSGPATRKLQAFTVIERDSKVYVLDQP